MIPSFVSLSQIDLVPSSDLFLNVINYGITDSNFDRTIDGILDGNNDSKEEEFSIEIKMVT